MLFLGILGLIIGSFLNVVIARVPDGGSVLRPRSACPRCQQPISARDNIPVLSWLLLHGRCRHCGQPISPLYPLVEIVTGALWALTGWWCLAQGSAVTALLPWLLVLVSASVALVVIDFQLHRLPDAIVLPLYPALLVGLVVAGLMGGAWNWPGALIGATAWLALVGGLWLVSGGRGMGFGDVKLAPILGATLGWLAWQQAIAGLLAAFIVGGVVGIALMVTGRARRGTRMPFGPYLVAGCAIGLVAGAALWDGYLRLATGG